MTVELTRKSTYREPLHLVRPTEDPIDHPIEKPVEPRRNEERDAAILAGAAAMLTVMARIVSVRLVLGLAAIGAFGLAVATTLHPSTPAIIVMGIFDVAVFVPVCVLESGVLTKPRG